MTKRRPRDCPREATITRSGPFLSSQPSIESSTSSRIVIVSNALAPPLRALARNCSSNLARATPSSVTGTSSCRAMAVSSLAPGTHAKTVKLERNFPARVMATRQAPAE